MATSYVPATGWKSLLRWYDPAVAILSRQAAFNRQLIENGELESKRRVLDVGCGSGTLALSVQEQYPHLELTAVDIDPAILRQAKVKPNSDTIIWSEADATDLPLTSSTFDSVFCSLLFHHLTSDEKRQTASEILRVLAPGGVLLFADYGKSAHWLAKLQFLPVRCFDGWGRTALNASGALPELLQEVGFEQIEQTAKLSTLLGTVRCLRAKKSN